MKKLLLNLKFINCAFLFMLICTNAVLAQKTIINETFGTIVINSPYTGGTSTVPASPNQITYTKTSTATTPGLASVATSSSNGYLSLTGGGGTSGVTYLTAPLPTNNFVSILKNNSYPITWTFNMRLNRTANIAGLTITSGTNYVPAEVLVSSNSDLLGSSTKGYAVSLSGGSTSSYHKIELSSFIAGLSSSSIVLTSPEFAAQDYVSVKVTYTPSTETWSLAVKSNGATAFSDPSTDTFSSTVSIDNAVNTSETMTHFGYYYSHMASGTVASAVFKNDNYKMVLESPIVALPTVEPRQVFSSLSNPKVSNLVAVGTAGATLKWCSVLGGTALTSNTPITSGTYYVTQTIGSIESDVVSTQVFVGDTTLKTLPLYEGFANYTIGDKLILMNNSAVVNAGTSNADGIGLGSWSITPSSNITDDVLIVASPTWTNTVLPAASGNAISFVGSGIDPELKFTNTTSGSLYSSFVFNAVDAATTVASTTTDVNYSTPTGFFSFMALSPSTVTPGSFNNDYASALMFRKNIASGKYNLGLSKSSDSIECDWSATEYDFNTQHLIVISYENIGDATATNQVAKLWIDPNTNTTPLPPPTLTQSNPTTSVSRDHIDRIKILQAASASTPTLIIDEIRVANNWGQALGGAATLGLVNNSISNLSIYPNPVTNGKLFITSSSNLEKEVVIFTTLGQQVLQDKTVSEAINVAALSQGTYFVRITEAGLTTTKKLIIK